MAISASSVVKTIGTPREEWTSMLPQWKRSRAILGGLQAAKEHDKAPRLNNLLVPFSTQMKPAQYELFKAEAELPGITAQFAKILVESLLRKRPVVDVGDTELNNWLLEEFGQDGLPIDASIAAAAQEELSTGQCWVFVDHPSFDETALLSLTPEEQKLVRPYPIIRRAEEVINWHFTQDKLGRRQLQFVITRAYEGVYKDEEVHPQVHEVIWKHFLKNGEYHVQKWIGPAQTDMPVEAGKPKAPGAESPDGSGYDMDYEIRVLAKGLPMDYIPAWPLSGAVDLTPPPLMPIIEKEIGLYNKMSRRNHLLYNTATFTPWIAADISDQQFDNIVEGGLGTWLRMPEGGTIGALSAPADSLEWHEKAIEAAILEMAKLGIRMLAPDTAQSGVALEIRNAAQTAQLGTLDSQITSTWKQVIRCMIHWYTGEIKPLNKISFSLSGDFLADLRDTNAMRLVTEWYENGLIPRSVWMNLVRENGYLPDGYDDVAGQKEISLATNLPTKEPLE